MKIFDIDGTVTIKTENPSLTIKMALAAVHVLGMSSSVTYKKHTAAASFKHIPNSSKITTNFKNLKKNN